MSNFHILNPHQQSPMAADTTTVPNTTTEAPASERIVDDWANVGLSVDIMRPRYPDEAVWSSEIEADEQDWQQQSYCCR